MGYRSGMLDNVIKVYVPGDATDGEYGLNSEGAPYEFKACIHAGIDWNRGAKALRVGALDAYDTLLVRTRYHEFLTRECRLEIDGATYAIDSCHRDKRRNTIQITCTELVNL